MKKLSGSLNKIILMLIYVLCMFVFSYLLAIVLKRYTENVELISVSVNIATYLLLIFASSIFLKDEIKGDFKVLSKSSAKKVALISVFGFVLANFASGLGTSISSLLGGSVDSQNQKTIVSLFLGKYGALIFIILVLIGPVVEELVFRKALHGTLRKFKMSPVLIDLISATLFGLVHVASGGDIVNVFPYLFMGLVLGGMELYTKNVFPSIFTHVSINFISLINLLFLNGMGLL